MQLDQFLTRVLPSEGSYYLIKGDNANRFTHTEFNSTTQMSSTATTLAQHRNNIFFSTGSFNPGTTREATDVLYKKSFYLDLDAGPGKDFPTKTDALKAFKKFKETSGILAPSIIVDSGNGIHLYWTLKEAIPVGTWLKIANLLKDTCMQLQFSADHAITADRARILRAPDTQNNKSTTPKDCKVLHSRDSDYTAVEFLNSIKKWASVKPALPDSLAGIEIGDDLSSGMDEGYRGDRFFKYGKDECLILQDMVATGGKDYTEASWMHAIGLLTFCEDGHEYIHAVSNQHTTYSERDTEYKWKVRLRGKEAEKFGPTLCKTLNKVCGGDKCSACPHNGRIKSPIVLFNPPYAGEDMPEGYSQSEAGGVWYKDPRDADAKAIHICNFNIRNVVRNIDTDSGGKSTTQLTFDSHLTNMLPITIDDAITEDFRKLKAAMSSQYRTIELTSGRKTFGTLMASWSTLLDTQGKSVRTQSRFGWVSHGKKHGFSVGGVTQWDDGTTTNSVTTDKKLAVDYSALGELKDWQGAVQFALDQNRQPINAVIASSFGAPLMKFTGEAGMILGLVSECSASGKSKALALASSVWGNPRKAINSMDDTHVARQIKMGTLCNLPMYWDEIRGLKDDKEFAKQLFRMCQGSDKNRGRADLTLASVGDWQTLMVATSNESLVSHVDAAMPNQSNAGRVRILEFEVPVVTKQQMVGSDIFLNLNDNYGLAGVIYGKYLAENHDVVRKRVRNFIAKINKALKCDSEDRFWVAGMACTIIGAQIATELELLNFDVAKLKAFFVTAIQGNKADIHHYHKTGAVTNVSEVGRFIMAMTGRGLHYNNIDGAGISTGLHGNTIVEGREVAYEFCPSNRRLKVNKGAFGDWLSRLGKDMNQVTSDLRKTEKGYKDMKTNFGEVAGGTYGVDVPAFIIDLP